MTWTAVRNRGEILRTVTAVADRRRDGLLPLDVEGVADAFDDELDLLGALQLRWHSRLSGRIERELSEQPLDLERAVITAWQATTDQLPGIRAVIDHYRDQPVDPGMADAMRVATIKEHALLAVSAGRAALADPGAAGIGAALEDRARATYLPRPGDSAAPGAPGAHAAPRLLSRLKAVVAA